MHAESAQCSSTKNNRTGIDGGLANTINRSICYEFKRSSVAKMLLEIMLVAPFFSIFWETGAHQSNDFCERHFYTKWTPTSQIQGQEQSSGR